MHTGTFYTSLPIAGRRRSDTDFIHPIVTLQMLDPAPNPQTGGEMQASQVTVHDSVMTAQDVISLPCSEEGEEGDQGKSLASIFSPGLGCVGAERRSVFAAL